MGNAATAKKGNEQESGEQSNTTDRARRVVLAFSYSMSLQLRGGGGRSPFSSFPSTVGDVIRRGIVSRSTSTIFARGCVIFNFIYFYLFVCFQQDVFDSLAMTPLLPISLENMSWMMRLACYRWRHGSTQSGSGPSSPCRSILAKAICDD